MKRLISLLTVAAFLISVPLVMAQSSPGGSGSGTAPATTPATPEKPAKTINCCVKGKCEQVKSEADCTKAGGKVVSDCKECK